jgi:predicted amidophosphoribosyltransferase
MKERGFSQNIRTDQAMPDDIRTNFDEDPLTYEQISNKDTLQKAQDIFNKGQAEAEADFYKSIDSKEFRPEDVPLAKLLAKQASEQGDIAKARQILSSIAEKLTEAGQFSQAAKILREADPETFLMTIDKQLKKLNKQGQKQYGKKWNDVDLTPGEIDAINKIPRGDQQAYESTWEQIGSRIAKELPSTGMEKFDAWRRMAMLLNPKTHIRNVGGNVIMMGMRKVSDTIGAALQKAFVPKGQRTQSVGWSLNKDIVAKVNDNWNTVKKDLLGESRWEIDNLKSLGMEKRIFDKGLPTKAVEALTGKKFDRGMLQWLNEFSLKTLNVEDNIFVERAYKDALGQYLQANNMDTVTDEAVAYATRRALEATFKQANELASTLNRWKQKPVVGKLVEGAVPFTKTPANIVMRGIEYSPGGIFKALYDVKAGKTAATVIEDLSKGLTGSAITALGFWLASMGWAKVDRDRSPKAEALYSEMGDQTNAINTPLGSYTFDWAQPFAIPLAMGIAAQEAIRQRKDGDSLIVAIKDGIAAGGDTVFNMTMLQNIRQIIGSYGSPTEKIMGIPIDYLEQAIFSAFGQAARTIDPVKRSTYDPNPTKQWLNTVKARVPGLSQTLEPALNIWGEEQTQGGALQQFINPGYFKPRNDDPVTNELARLYSEVNDTDLLPKVAPNSFSSNNKTYTLTAEQKANFQRKMGQENYIDMRAIIHTDRYQNATDDNKAKMLKKIADKNYEEAKEMIVGK